MDRNIIKKHLSSFVSEGAVPGITVTDKAKKESGKINKAGVKDIEKDVKDFEKVTKAGAEKMAQNKFNYNGDKEIKYHDEVEIRNGQEMIEYDREPNQDFKDRAKEAIEGSSRMGNNPEWANVVQAGQGGDPTFGKNLVKTIKAATKARTDAEDSVISFGNDIETVPKGSKPKGKHSAIAEGENRRASDAIKYSTPESEPTEQEYNFYNSDDAKSPLEKDDKKDNKKPQIQKESMKRLKFKKDFNGVGNALKLIPESYRTNNKEFEMTDGNETYRIRWEGTLSEGKAVVLAASNQTMVNEDMQRMKQLMGYKSQDTLGLVRGKARIDENAVFSDIWNKSKVLLEGEEIEGHSAQKGEWDKVKKSAKEATKDINGSTSDDKGTKAPKAKTGSMESFDNAKSHAPEAKKHVEGSVNAEIGMGLGEQEEGEGEWDQIDVPQAAAHGNPSKTAYAPAPKTGEWEKASVPQAADAKKHVHMNEGLVLNGILFEPIVVKKKTKLVNEEVHGQSPLHKLAKSCNSFNEFVQKAKEHLEGASKSNLKTSGKVSSNLKNSFKSIWDERNDDDYDTLEEQQINENWMEESMYEEGWGDDKALKPDSNGNPTTNVKPHVWSEDIDDGNDLFRKFFITRFEREPEQDPSYFETWKERLSKPNPEGYMDSKSLEVWNMVNGHVDDHDEDLESWKQNQNF